ncbi:hypothetical protein [Salinibacter ruber]|uniref:hypothetical protein n=1 Tax=Salinibacter ruber TaxID=146919 RepID=UPI0013C2C45C|nr:hypothetical protein [Salinibacter ruber]
MVDFLGQYEKLKEGLKNIKNKIGVEGKIKMPKFKSKYRPKRSHYREEITDEARKRIEIVCAKEIKK